MFQRGLSFLSLPTILHGNSSCCEILTVICAARLSFIWLLLEFFDLINSIMKLTSHRRRLMTITTCHACHERHGSKSEAGATTCNISVGFKILSNYKDPGTYTTQPPLDAYLGWVTRGSPPTRVVSPTAKHLRHLSLHDIDTKVCQPRRTESELAEDPSLAGNAISQIPSRCLNLLLFSSGPDSCPLFDVR
jgi:hypothetical protein